MAQIPLGGSIGVPGAVAVLGNYNVIFATNANHTMSATEYSNYFLDITSSVSLTTTRQLIAPLTQGQAFIIQNNTTGGQSITVIGSTGTGVTIANGSTTSVVCDGINYLPTSGTSFTAGGDLSGSSTNQTVLGIQTNPVYAQVLGASQDGYALIWNADGYWLATPISGGTTVTGTGLWYNSSGVLNNAAITLTGDVSEGALSAGHVPLTVTGLDGTPIVITSLTTGNGFSYNGTDWVNTALNLAGGSAYVTGLLPVANIAHGTSAQVLMSNGTPVTTWITISGDVAITSSGATTVTAIQGNAIQSGALGSSQDGYVLSWSGTQWAAVPASSTVVEGQNYSFSNTSSDISGYDQLLNNATGSQNTLTASTSSSSKVLIKAFGTVASDPNVDFINAGLWQFNFYAFASLTGAFTTVLIFDVYTRTSGGAETLLFSATSQNIQFTSAQLYTLLYNYQSNTVIPSTNRLVIKVSAQSSNVVATTVSFVFDGTTMASLVQTPITGSALQLGGDVTGTTSANTLSNIQSVPLVITTLTTGNQLLYNGTNWINSALNLAGGAGYVSGVLPAGNQAAQSLTLTGDATSSGGTTAGATTVVVNIHGASVPIAGSLTTGNVLQVSGSSALSYAAVNLAGGSNFVTGNLPIGNVAPGTSAQVLLSNATPASTWTTLSGDVSISATGATTVLAIHGTTVPATPSANQVLQATNSTTATWVAPTALGAVTWANDLSGNSTTTSTAQYVSSLSFSSSAAGGAIAINGTGTSLSFASTNTAPSIVQVSKSTNSGTGSSLTIQAQNETGTSSTGGALFLTSGTGTSLDGYVWIQGGGVNILECEAGVTSDGYVSNTQIVRFDGQESVFANNTTTPIYAFNYTLATTDGYTHNAIVFSPAINTNSRWTVSAIARDQSNSNDFGVDLAIFQVRNVAGVLALNPTSPQMINEIPSSGYGSCALSASISGTSVVIAVTGYGVGETLNWNVYAQVATVA